MTTLRTFLRTFRQRLNIQIWWLHSQVGLDLEDTNEIHIE